MDGRNRINYNGYVKGNEERDWTYTKGRGESVIDYVLGDEEVRD